MKKGKYQLEKKCSFWKSLYLTKKVDIETVLLTIIPIILAVIAIPITSYVSLSYQMDALEIIFVASIIISGIVLAYYISVLIIALIILLFSALKDIKYMATSCIKFIKALLAQRYLPISEQDLTNNNIRTTEEYWDMMEYILRLGDKETIIYEKNKEQCQLVYEEYFNTNDFNAKLLQLYEKFLNEQKEGSTTHPLKGVGL